MKDKYFEDDTLANDWIEEKIGRIFLDMFRHQRDWIYMAGELGEGRDPMIKSVENFNFAFDRAWADNIGWLKSFVKMEVLRGYAEDDIDFPHYMAAEYNEYMGFEPGDDGYVEGKDL